MLTANASEEHRRASLAAGANRHVSKPFTPDMLISAVEDLVAAA